jgi:hypothetical protein
VRLCLLWSNTAIVAATTVGSYCNLFFYESVEVLRLEFNITDVPFNRDLSLCYYLNEDRNLFHLK